MTTYQLYKVSTSTNTEDHTSGGVYYVDKTTSSIYTPVLVAVGAKAEWQSMYRTVISSGNAVKMEDWESTASDKRYMYQLSQENFIGYALKANLYTSLTDSQKLEVLNMLISESNTKYILKEKR